MEVSANNDEARYGRDPDYTDFELVHAFYAVSLLNAKDELPPRQKQGRQIRPEALAN
jgi:hypothetical protein